jgi:hypothetical protein
VVWESSPENLLDLQNEEMYFDDVTTSAASKIISPLASNDATIEMIRKLINSFVPPPPLPVDYFPTSLTYLYDQQEKSNHVVAGATAGENNNSLQEFLMSLHPFQNTNNNNTAKNEIEDKMPHNNNFNHLAYFNEIKLDKTSYHVGHYNGYNPYDRTVLLGENDEFEALLGRASNCEVFITPHLEDEDILYDSDEDKNVALHWWKSWKLPSDKHPESSDVVIEKMSVNTWNILKAVKKYVFFIIKLLLFLLFNNNY